MFIPQNRTMTAFTSFSPKKIELGGMAWAVANDRLDVVLDIIKKDKVNFGLELFIQLALELKSYPILTEASKNKFLIDLSKKLEPNFVSNMEIIIHKLDEKVKQALKTFNIQSRQPTKQGIIKALDEIDIPYLKTWVMNGGNINEAGLLEHLINSDTPSHSSAEVKENSLLILGCNPKNLSFEDIKKAAEKGFAKIVTEHFCRQTPPAYENQETIKELFLHVIDNVAEGNRTARSSLSAVTSLVCSRVDLTSEQIIVLLENADPACFRPLHLMVEDKSEKELTDIVLVMENSGKAKYGVFHELINVGADPSVLKESTIKESFGSPSEAVKSLDEDFPDKAITFFVKRHVTNSNKTGKELAKNCRKFLAPYYEKA